MRWLLPCSVATSGRYVADLLDPRSFKNSMRIPWTPKVQSKKPCASSKPYNKSEAAWASAHCIQFHPLTCSMETETVKRGSSSREIGSKRVSFRALVSAYSFSPECRFNSEKVPMQPRKRWSRPIFHVTKSGLRWENQCDNAMCWIRKTTHNEELEMPKWWGSTWRSRPWSSLWRTSKQKNAISGIAVRCSTGKPLELAWPLVFCCWSCWFEECPFWSGKNFLLAIVWPEFATSLFLVAKKYKSNFQHFQHKLAATKMDFKQNTKLLNRIHSIWTLEPPQNIFYYNI